MLLIDAANVVGSRPNQWWRDRPGAAQRLHGQVAEAIRAGRLDPPVTLVLEGAARSGPPEGTSDGVTVVHAPGEGDATLLAVAGDHISAGGDAVLVTADRALARAAEAQGAAVRRPSWLLGLVEPPD